MWTWRRMGVRHQADRERRVLLWRGAAIWPRRGYARVSDDPSVGVMGPPRSCRTAGIVTDADDQPLRPTPR